MNWPLTRLVAGWTCGVWLVLTAWQVTVPPPTAEDWIAEDPLRTAGCPGLQPQLAAWQEELSLHDWTIEVECGMNPALKDVVGLVKTTPSTKSARIWIRDGLPRGYQTYVLVHELVHVGVHASRWWVPDDQENETFVDAGASRVFFSRAREVRQRMVREVQRRGRAAATAGPEATVRARTLEGVRHAALAGPS